MIGRIHKIAANDYEVQTAGGKLHCRFRGRLKRGRGPALKLAAVGDEVEVTPGTAHQGTIEKVLPRRSKLSRHDVHRTSYEQVIVANVDALLIVQAAQDPPFNDLVVDKCTVMAAANRLPCVVVVNKVDLGSPDLSTYERAGFACVRTSARTGRGVDDLRRFIAGKTVVLLGPSGVGKSSLLNSLEAELALKTGRVSRSGEGRHTTSWVELVSVAGGYVADTPGLEFFTLWGVTPDNLKDHFLDFVDVAGDCRFRNCSHVSETDCAVRSRAASSRYRNYLDIRGKLRDERAVFEEE